MHLVLWSEQVRVVNLGAQCKGKRKSASGREDRVANTQAKARIMHWSELSASQLSSQLLSFSSSFKEKKKKNKKQQRARANFRAPLRWRASRPLCRCRLTQLLQAMQTHQSRPPPPLRRRRRQDSHSRRKRSTAAAAATLQVAGSQMSSAALLCVRRRRLATAKTMPILRAKMSSGAPPLAC